MPTLLEFANVTRRFGALTVTDNLSFGVRQGEALGILGPNGAGKSTLFNLICGALACDAGCVRLSGEDLAGVAPHERCRRGIGRTYQIPLPFGDMSVFENLLVASEFGGGKGTLADRCDYCALILRRTGLWRYANMPAGDLSLIRRKRLELARALASRPKLLLLDEIAGGLTERESDELVELILSIHQSGTTIVWIEHVVHALLRVVDRLLVINFGKLVAEGDPEQVMADATVRQIYMGIAGDA